METVKMRKIIAVSGKARSGKDHFAQRAQASGFVRIGFADAVKQAACIMLTWYGDGRPRHLDIETIEEWKTKEEVPEKWDVNMRAALIKIGDGFREICKTIWIDRVFSTTADKIVITDVRYLNELQRANDEKALVVRLSAPGRQGAGNMKSNRSETELDHIDDYWSVGSLPSGLSKMPVGCPYDYVIVNDSDLESFDACIEEVIELSLLPRGEAD